MSETVKDLEGAVEVFEEVLNDYGVISKAEAEAMVEKAKKDLHKADEASVADDPEEFGEEGQRYTLQDLKDRLPGDMWETVRLYIAGGEQLSDDDSTDVEKAVGSAIATSGDTLRRVRSNATAPVSKSDRDPAYDSTGDAEASPGDMLLKHLDEELGVPTGTVSKSEGKSKSDNPALSHIDEADL